MGKLENYLILAEDFSEKRRFQEALQAYRRAYEFAEDREKTDILFEMADIYLCIENYEKSEEMYKKILEIDNLSGAYFGLAIVNDAISGPVKKSIYYYKRAIEISPDYDRAYYYLGHSYLKAEERISALSCFLKTYELCPDDFVVLNDIGSMYEEDGEYTSAKEYFLRSLELNPDYGRALYNMGVVEKALGEIDTALMYYKRSAGVWDFHLNYLNMSAIYIDRGDFSSARNVLDMGIEVAPSENLYYNRACVNVYENKMDRAMEDLSKAIEYNRDAYNWARSDPDLMEVVKIYDNHKD